MEKKRGTRCRRRLQKGGGQDAADAEGDKMPPGEEGDKMLQTPGRRGTRNAGAPKQDSHYPVEVITEPPPTHGRRGTRSVGATKSTAAEESAPALGEYAKLTPPPQMVLSGL